VEVVCFDHEMLLFIVVLSSSDEGMQSVDVSAMQVIAAAVTPATSSLGRRDDTTVRKEPDRLVFWSVLW
jgi:hypothetical protein